MIRERRVGGRKVERLDSGVSVLDLGSAGAALFVRATAAHRSMSLGGGDAHDEAEAEGGAGGGGGDGGGEADKVLFLDVDGVLVCRRSLLYEYDDDDVTLLFDPKGKCFSPLERRCVSELRRVVDATACAVVLSTTWRLEEGLRQFLVGALAEHGIDVIGDTPSLPSSQGGRGAEVAAWLASAKHDGGWCILDDSHAGSFELAGMTTRLVATCIDDGLTPALADEAIRLLSQAGSSPPI